MLCLMLDKSSRHIFPHFHTSYSAWHYLIAVNWMLIGMTSLRFQMLTVHTLYSHLNVTVPPDWIESDLYFLTSVRHILFLSPLTSAVHLSDKL